MSVGRLPRIVSVVVVAALFAVLMSQRIAFHNSDLGRHLKNGELFFADGTIPRTNLYSFTFPDFPFVNHHWGSGVLFQAIHSTVGFTGLSLFYTAIQLLTFLAFLRLAWKISRCEVAVFLALFALPLLFSRNEIRPEGFSYLLSAVFFWVLWHVRELTLRRRWLFVLPALSLLWVNLHIYFVFGLALIGLFALDALAARQRRELAKSLLGVTVACVVASAINPFGLAGLLHPFRIFQHYGYRIIENQSVGTLAGLVTFPPASFLKVLFAIASIAVIVVGIRFRRFSLLGGALLAVFGVLAWSAVRNLGMFGYIFMPATALVVQPLFEKAPHSRSYFAACGGALLAMATGLYLFQPTFWKVAASGVGVGLVRDGEAVGRFLVDHDVRGPFFNDFDIGSYLIYYLYPRQQVFVDNRPEAYPERFWVAVYVAAQARDDAWSDAMATYGFNAVVVYREDLAEWTKALVVRLIDDSAWAVVYVDDHALVFARRGGPNQAVIDGFEIPRSRFTSETR